jgi:tight adherence protein B
MDMLLYALPGLGVFTALALLLKGEPSKEEQAQANIKALLSPQPTTQAVVAVTLFETEQTEAPLNTHEDSLLKKRPKAESWRAKLETRLERGNLLIRVEEFLGFCAVSSVVCSLLGVFMFGLPWPFALLLGVAAFCLPSLMLNLRCWWRLRVATSQFPDVLDTLVSCFKTGYGFNKAVQQVAQNYHDPWGTEFGKMALETSLGANLDETLGNLSQRLPSPDVDLFVTCMLIQKETGGNMTELLGNLSHTCRERFKLARKVSAISAQGKLTSVIVCMVPLTIMGFMYLFMSEAVTEFLSNVIGQIVIGVAMGWMALGAVVLWKMVQIEV